MKAERSANLIVYPDVGRELVDLVSQQPLSDQPVAVRLRRPGADEYRALQAAGISLFEQFTRRERFPLASFGFIPRPPGWSGVPAVFHEPESKRRLQSVAEALQLHSDLETVLSQAAGRSPDIGASLDVRSFMPKGYKGLIFPPNLDQTENELQFAGERSLHSIDELRDAVLGSPGNTSGSAPSNAFLQLRSKLIQLSELAKLIQGAFEELDYVELCRFKAPQLC